MNIPWKFHPLIRPVNVLPLSYPTICWETSLREKLSTEGCSFLHELINICTQLHELLGGSYVFKRIYISKI